MNKTVFNLIIFFCILVFISGCMRNTETVSTPVEEIIAPPPIVTATNTYMTEAEGDQNCWEPDWKRIWSGSFKLITIAEGPGNYWFLTTNTLDRVSKSDEGYQFFWLNDKLPCKNCEDILNGSLVISDTGEAWVGLSFGLLIIDENENWRIISTKEIIPATEDILDVRVLLSDVDGNIWIANEDNLCSFDGIVWHCNQIQGLRKTYTRDKVPYDVTAKILSAVSGQDDQIWFGTENGKMIWFDGEKFEVYDIHELTNSKSFSPDFGSLVFDKETNTLWALNTYGAHGYESIGVYRRNSDESWQFYKKELFFSQIGDSQYLPLTAISITNNGKLWVGMQWGLTLVYSDGFDWYTFDGEKLPLDMSEKPRSRFVEENDCNTPGSYIVDLLTTMDGNLLIGNLSEGFIYTNNKDITQE